MDPPQCPICAEHWINEGRPMGHYLIVSRGGHIPGVQHDNPTPEAVAAAVVVPEQRAPEQPTAARPQCTICKAYWSNEGRPRDHYLILSKGDHIPGVHDVPARESVATAVEEPAPPPRESRVAQCATCADYWIREGRPMDHYLIVSRGGHIPEAQCPSSSPHQTSPEVAGTSQVPDSNSELHNEINRLKSQVNQLLYSELQNEINRLKSQVNQLDSRLTQVNQLDSRLSRIERRMEVPVPEITVDEDPEMEP